MVEDMAFMRRALSMAIQKLGMAVQEAGSAAEAKRLLKDKAPELIFLDIGLPDMDGIEMCRWIRCQQGMEKIPVIICTAHQGREEVVRAIEARATDYILKPIQAEVVQERVRKHLGLGDDPLPGG